MQPLWAAGFAARRISSLDSASRLSAYKETLADLAKREDFENFNLATSLGHGLMAGLRPEKVKTDLGELGIDAERLNRLVDRKIQQFKLTYHN